MAAISRTSPKAFLGAMIPNVKILSSKIDAIINRLNTITTSDNTVTATTATITTANITTLNTTSNFVAVSADGAISVPSSNTTYYITKAGVAAMTLADPTATTHDGLTLRFISTTSNAHTLSNAAGSGFNAGGAASDIGTFGGAKGDNIVITAYQGKWYVVSKTNVTLA